MWCDVHLKFQKPRKSNQTYVHSSPLSMLILFLWVEKSVISCMYTLDTTRYFRANILPGGKKERKQEKQDTDAHTSGLTWTYTAWLSAGSMWLKGQKKRVSVNKEAEKRQSGGNVKHRPNRKRVVNLCQKVWHEHTLGLLCLIWSCNRCRKKEKKKTCLYSHDPLLQRPLQWVKM